MRPVEPFPGQARTAASGLAGTWFPSFVGLGLILGIVAGGTHAATVFALVTQRPRALLVATVAGFPRLIWIFTEVAIIVEALRKVTGGNPLNHPPSGAKTALPGGSGRVLFHLPLEGG